VEGTNEVFISSIMHAVACLVLLRLAQTGRACASVCVFKYSFNGLYFSGMDIANIRVSAHCAQGAASVLPITITRAEFVSFAD
jgi:hypothetical protein